MTKTVAISIIVITLVVLLIGKPSVGEHGLIRAEEKTIYFEPYWSDRQAWAIHCGRHYGGGKFVALLAWRDIHRDNIPCGVIWDDYGLRIQKVQK